MVDERARDPGQPERAHWGLWTTLVVAGLLLLLGLAGPRPALPHAPTVRDSALFPPRDPGAGAYTADEDDAPQSLEQLRAAIADVVAQGDEVGVAIAIIEDGEMVMAEGFGLADRERERPVTADTLFRVGSVSKSVIGLLALRAESQGWVDLDAPIANLAPDFEFENAFEAEAPITLAHLLEHSAGFDEVHFNELVAEESQAGWSLDRVLGLNPASRRARWRPGTRHAYSQANFTAAAHIIATRAGRDWEALVRDEVLAPAKMHGASFRLDAATRPRVAAGYDGPQRLRVPPWQMHHRPAGNLLVSARDLGHLLEVLIARGEIEGHAHWSATQLERFERGATLPVSEHARTYGLGVYPQQFRGHSFSGHGGWVPGHQAWYAYSPELRAGVVMLANRTGPMTTSVWQLRFLIANYLIAKAPEPGPAPEVDVSEAELRALEGAYRFESPPVQLLSMFQRMHMTRKFEVRDKRLVMHTEFGPETLYATDPMTFRREEEREASVSFWRDAQGDLHVLDADWGFASYARESTAQYLTLTAWFACCRLALLLACASVLIWLPRRVWSPRAKSLWVWPSLAAWASMATLVALQSAPLARLTCVNARSLFIFFCSWAIAVATARAVWTCLVHARAPQFGRATRVATATVSVLLASWCVALYSAGWVGLRTWVY